MRGYIKLLLLLCSILAFNLQLAIAKTSNFEAKIAVIDVQSILEHSVAIIKVKEVVENINESIQKDIVAKEVEFKKIEEELILKKQRDEIDQKTFDIKVQEFTKKVNQVQKNFQKRKSKLENAHSEAVGKVHLAMMDIINELSKKYGFNLVIPSSQLLFVDKKLNITPEVIELLNERLAEIKINID